MSFFNRARAIGAKLFNKLKPVTAKVEAVKQAVTQAIKIDEESRLKATRRGRLELAWRRYHRNRELQRLGQTAREVKRRRARNKVAAKSRRVNRMKMA